MRDPETAQEGPLTGAGPFAGAPLRLRLSRRPGADLRRQSRTANGRDAVRVARPGPWGNPFTVTTHREPGSEIRGILSGGYIAVPTVEDVVACFREMMAAPSEEGQRAYEMRKRLPELRDKNLACWCKLCPEHRVGKPLGVRCDACAPCHADILLELAAIRCDDPETTR